MARRVLTIEEMLAMLAEAPPRIAVLTEGRQPAALQARPAPNEWSANDVLAHLRACADVWGDCIATILAEEHPTIRAINPGAWIASTDYPERIVETLSGGKEKGQPQAAAHPSKKAFSRFMRVSASARSK